MRAASRTEVRRWWGERWLEALDASASAARRVQRGLALARRGAVEDVRVEPGRIRGTVAEDRAEPIEVELAWPIATDDAWSRAIQALASELRFAAALLDGDLPPDLATALAEAGVVLFPDHGELVPACPCPERAQLCRHAAALHAAAAVLIDRDPTLLFELRGRSRDDLLRRVRTDRGDDAVVVSFDPRGDLEQAHGDLEEIELRPTPVEDPAAPFLRLGPPPGVDDPSEIVEVIERTAAAAWRLAAGEGADAADEELLLTELRAQRVATAGSLAERLGRDAGEVRGELDRLFDEGVVMRTGSGDRARYRAASG